MDDTSSRVIADAAPPFPSFTALRAMHSELLQRDPGTEDAKSSLADVENFIKQAQATGAILSDDEERRSSQNILNYWVSALYRQDQVARLATLSDYDPKLTARIEDVQCPYPGVRAFEEQDSQFFFGRQRQIDYMLNRLREDRLLVLVGPSGSGKTSLVRAGLLPALKKEELNSVNHFYFPPAVPGSEPLMNLARMVKHAKSDAGEDPHWLQQQIEGFKNDEGHLLKLIEETTDKPAVIFIDQGEELYELGGNRWIGPLKDMLNLDQGGKALRPFLGNLLHVVQSPLRRHIVILARRIGDYEPYFRRLPSKFKDVFEPARMVLPALYASELRDAIEKPAELLGVKFDELSLASSEAPEEAAGSRTKETTVQALVKEITSEPAGLPLLQFILPRLWEKREGDKIPDHAFRDLRSCRAALADTAEEFFAKLDFLDQRACRRLLSQLIKLDGELRAHTYSVQRVELYPAAEKKSRVDSLIDRLSQKELIRVSKGEAPADDVVELVHDSLLRSWPRLNSWIGSKRRARWWSKIAAGFLLLVLIGGLALIGVFFLGQRQQVEQSLELARLSNKQFSNNRFDLALLLGREAYALDPNPTTHSNSLKLLYALQSTSRPRSYLHKKKFEADDLAFSIANGRDPVKVAAIENNGEIVIWDLGARSIDKTLVSAKRATYPLAFSPDGKTLATASRDQGVTVILWDVASGHQRNLTQHQEPSLVTSMAFSPDGKTLVTGGEDGSVVQLDLSDINNVKSTALYKHSRQIADIPRRVAVIAFSADGNLLASGSADGTALLWELRAKGRQPRMFAVRGEVKGSRPGAEFKPIVSLAFGPDKNLLAAASDDEAFIWNIATGEQESEFSTGPTPSGILVSFSADGKLLAAFSFDGAIILWDVVAKRTVGRQLYKPAPCQSAAFSSDGNLLALPSEDGVAVWDIFNQGILKVDHTINSVAFSHDKNDKKLATGEGEGTITLWKVESSDEHKILGRPIKGSSGVLSLAFSADDKFLAAGLQNGTISLRDPNDLKQIKVFDAQSGKLLKEIPADSGETPADATEAPGASSSTKGPPVFVSKVIFDANRGSYLLAAVVEPIETGLENENKQSSKIIVWDAATEASPSEILIDADSVVTSLAFSRDGILAWGSVNKKSNASDSDDKKNSQIMLWKGQKLAATLQSDDEVSSLAFSPDGEILAGGLNNGQIFLWNLAARQKISDKPIEDSSGRVTDLAFSTDGATLASATNKRLRNAPPGIITLWDFKTREPIGNPLVGYDGEISGIAFSSDNRILASGNEGSIVLWDVDVEGADKRFCKIVDCEHEQPEVADQVRKKYWFQILYSKLSSWWRGNSKVT